MTTHQLAAMPCQQNMSLNATSRHFAAVLQPGRFGSKADINFDAS
jgi:hypothetical protein